MEIKAFKALRFDGSVVGDPADCIAPPYDVIDDEARDALYAKSPFNLVRVTKGKTTLNDTPENNQYTRAAEYLNAWIKQGALKADDSVAIYGYVQDFDIDLRHYQRSGFVALGKLEEFGNGVWPHEKTLAGPKADRLKLMHAKAAHLGQIFMLYDDPAKIADGIINNAATGESLIDFTDDNNVRHRLFAIDDAEEIEAITKMMSDKKAVIADGHHRYETALEYYKQTRNPAALHRMMTFVNVQNEGLIILPTHRVVANVAGFNIDNLISTIKEAFDITEYSFASDEEKTGAKKKMFAAMKASFEKDNNAFGIYAGAETFYFAELKNKTVMDAVCPQMSSAVKELDVNVLHKLILEEVLGIGEKQLAEESNIEYIKDIGDAIDKSIAGVDAGSSQAVFFMNPTKIQQVQAVAEAGEKMPQKSTFFYPKIYTGLVINKL